MNLLDPANHWVPFRLRDGRIEYAPVTAVVREDVVDTAFPRADFQGAAWQLLIGVLQTAYAPETRKAWRLDWQEPPSAEDLAARFAPYRHAFELFGGGPRFMQDLDSLDHGSTSTASSLLIEAPGAQSVKFNTDHFVRRGVGDELCPGCAALGLFNLQTTGPAGGTGYRVGIRGGGPLTTLVLPDDPSETLWHKLLLNLLTRDAWPYSDPSPDDPRLFPWLGPTRTSEARSSTPVTTPDDVHPLHMYWAMPNRIRLDEEEADIHCRVCGHPGAVGVREVRMTNYGTNYDGPWQHPLTPYRTDPKKNDPPLSQKGQQGGLGYRHWESFVLPREEGQGYIPARVVTDYLTTKYPTLARLGQDPGRQARLWVFGYDLKQNKPRGWYSIHMPLVVVDPSQRDLLAYGVRLLTDGANKTAWLTRECVKAAWFSRPGDAKGDFSWIDQRIWEQTSASFYGAVRSFSAELEEGARTLPAGIASDWLRSLQTAARTVFDDLALCGDATATDWKRVVAARDRLNRRLYGERELKALKTIAEQEEAA